MLYFELSRNNQGRNYITDKQLLHIPQSNSLLIQLFMHELKDKFHIHLSQPLARSHSIHEGHQVDILSAFRLINLPATMPTKSSILPGCARIAAKIIERQTSNSKNEFESLSIISNFIESRKDNMFSDSKKQQTKSKVKHKVLSHQMQKYKFMGKNASLGGLNKKLIFSSGKLAKPGSIEETDSEAESSEDVHSMKYEPTVDLLPDLELLMEKSSKNEEPIAKRIGPKKSHFQLKRVNTVCTVETGFGENTMVRVPITAKAKTLSRVQKDSVMVVYAIEAICKPPLSLTMQVHPDSAFSTSEIKSYFSTSDSLKLAEIYRKQFGSNKIAEHARSRLCVYQKLAMDQVNFPSQALCEALDSKCQAIANLYASDLPRGRSIEQMLIAVRKYQSILLDNLERILAPFISIEEFEMVAAALIKSPGIFLTCSLDNSKNLSTSLDLSTYKAVSERLVKELEGWIERSIGLTDYIEDLNRRPRKNDELLSITISKMVDLL